MSRSRKVVAGIAGAAAAFATGKLLAARREPWDAIDEDLLGAARGRPRTLRGPRASRLYTEWFPVEDGDHDQERGTLVFTHGWCVTEAIWDYQKRALGTGPFGMVTWDLPGHGHSSPLDRSHLTIELAIEALARVVDAVEDQRIVLVGHSLGGVLALGYLLRHPETARARVRGAVLAATPFVHYAGTVAGKWPGSSLSARALGIGMQLAVENGLVDQWFAKEAGSPDPRASSYRLMRTGFGIRPDPAHVRFVRDMAASVPPSVRADTFRAMTGLDLRPRLPEVKTPTLVLIGGRDRLVNPEESRSLAGVLPNAKLEEFPEAGHALFLERHEEFNSLVRRFAAQRLGRPGPRARSRLPRAG